MLASELGKEWQSELTAFELIPFAAASIGQVHRAVLRDGIEVAMKIQYPGVAKGIESDIDNLVGVLRLWNVFPPCKSLIILVFVCNFAHKACFQFCVNPKLPLYLLHIEHSFS